MEGRAVEGVILQRRSRQWPDAVPPIVFDAELSLGGNVVATRLAVILMGGLLQMT